MTIVESGALLLAEHSHRASYQWGQKLFAWVKKPFYTLNRPQALTSMGFQRSMKCIWQGFLRTVRRPVNHPEAKKLAKRFRGRQADGYFTFLTEAQVEPTNNATGREIRQVVIDGRVTQGTRGDRGQRWCERIWIVLAGCRK